MSLPLTFRVSFRFAVSLLGLCALLWVPFACVPPGEDTGAYEHITVDFNDVQQRKIYGYQDRLQVDSLLPYLSSDQIELRYLAARAFGSLLDERAVPPLARLLNDANSDIRAAAAFALGQQGDASAIDEVLGAFAQTDTAGVYAQANAALLEAAGKLGDGSTLTALTGISSYLPTDTALLVGQARGIYRLGLRGVLSDRATALMLRRATQQQWPPQARLIAAHYLRRADVQLDSARAVLASAVRTEPDVYVRSALAAALGKTTGDELGETMSRLFRTAEHPLVKLGLLEGMGKLPYPEVRDVLLKATRDANPAVAATAASSLATMGAPEDAVRYWRTARDSVQDVSVRLTLYGAALRHLPAYMQDTRGYINSELIRSFRQNDNTVDRANTLRALGNSPWNFRFLVEQALEQPTTPVQVAAAEALDAIAAREDIRKYFRGSYPTVRREYAAYLRNAVEGGDAGLQAVAAQTLTHNDVWDFAGVYAGDLVWLQEASSKLKLPRDTETAYLLDGARAALQPGYTATTSPPTYNHDINWDIYRSLQPGLEVAIETPRGLITIDLLENDAPGTVINFVQLVRNGFYNGKTFHRIVPGFVTQGGGPRGDGYGSLDYTLRTETPPGIYYDAPGYVGMASAGRHTEGVQFFFTHQPTPHLDGRYTIFGKVREGMDNVLALRQGDEMRMRLQ